MLIPAQLEKLRREVAQHAHAYYVLAAPTITDHEYDRLFRQLQELEAKHPEFADPNSPTARVGLSVPNSFTKVKHARPMLSLENAFTVEEAYNFFHSSVVPDGTVLVLEPKIDGLSLSIIYEHGKLVRAVTRGNHEEGDDVTANVRTIRSIPTSLGGDINLEVRGEVYLSKEQFKKLNEQQVFNGDELYANARNAAAGSLKLKDSRECATKQLSFLAYDLYPRAGMVNRVDISILLDELGFETVPPCAVTFNKANLQVSLHCFELERKSLPYDTDGAVFKVNNLVLEASLGSKTRVPRWAVAYKFEAEKAITTLKGITLQVGRLGTITPVAELEPISVGGATVRRATLCNQDEIDRLMVNIGDSVFVSRMGEVIPKVNQVSKKHTSSTWQMPFTCPCCLTDLIRHEGEANHYCPNRDCHDQVVARLRHFVAKGALDWDGFGDSQVEEMVKHGVRTFHDLFIVDPIFLKAAARKKFLAQRELVKQQPLWRKIYALGIEGVGQTLSKELTDKWQWIGDMLTADMAPKGQVTEMTKFLGPITGQNFTAYMLDFADELVKLEQVGFEFIETQPKAVGSLTGKTFVLTGAMTTGTRPQVSKTIEQYGGTVKGGVNKDVQFLVVGSEGGRGKADAAAKHGTKCISEEELYAMMGIEMPIPRDLSSDSEGLPV